MVPLLLSSDACAGQSIPGTNYKVSRVRSGQARDKDGRPFDAILAANPDKGKDMLTELSFSEASILYEKLLKDGPDVLARLVSRASDE